MSPLTKKSYFENFDGWRVVCFTMVFLYHSFYTSNPEFITDTTYIFWKKDIFGNGHMGVNFFFVLSGFLITYLLLKEQEETGKINVGKFIMRRILRIWPLFFFCVGFGFFIFPQIKAAMGQETHETAHLWTYLTFTNNFDLIKHGIPDSSVLGVLWSIAVEEQFYIIWPILLTIIPRRFYIHTMIALMVVHVIFRIMNDKLLVYDCHTLSCMSDILIGSIGAWLAFNKQRFVAFFEKIPRWSIVLVYLVFLTLFLFKDEFVYWWRLYAIFDRVIISTTILFILLEQSFAKNSIFKMSNWKRISSWGKYTYGMYCLHFIAILITLNIIPRLYDNNTYWSIFIVETIVAFLLTLLISKASYLVIEQPFLKLKNKFTTATN